MTVTQLLPQLRQLSRLDKLHVMQFLVSELAEEEIKKPTKEKLFDCLLNQDQLQDQIRLP